MAGVKHRSGRKSKYDEYATAELLGMSLKTVRDFLKDESQPIDKRADLGMRYLAKHMPDKVESRVITVSLNESIINRLLLLMEDKDSSLAQALPIQDAIVIEPKALSDKASELVKPGESGVGGGGG